MSDIETAETKEPEGNGVELIDFLKSNGFQTVLMKPSTNDPTLALLVYSTKDGYETVAVVASSMTNSFEDPQDLVDWITSQKEEATVEKSRIITRG